MAPSTSLGLFLIAGLIALVSCSIQGPPIPAACSTMTPGHSPSSDTGAAPYRITINPATYGPGGVVTATLEKTGTHDFRGFMVQARKKSGGSTPVGTFSNLSKYTKVVMCTTADSTWVHRNNFERTSVTATWTAPYSDQGDLYFQASIVQVNRNGNSIFYENVKSPDLVSSGVTQAPDADMTTSGATNYNTGGNSSTTPLGGEEMMTTTENNEGIIRVSLIFTAASLLIVAVTGHFL